MTALEKIDKELLKEIVVPIQAIAEYLKKEIEVDEELSKRVMIPENTLSKCYGYVFDKAKDSAKGARGIAVTNEQVFSWVREYYMAEDVKEEKKEEEAAEAEDTKEVKKAPKKAAKKSKVEEEKPTQEEVIEVEDEDNDDSWLG